MFTNIHFLERTFLKIAFKQRGFYVRDTEFLPEFEVSSEIKISGDKIADRGTKRTNIKSRNVTIISGRNNKNVVNV